MKKLLGGILAVAVLTGTMGLSSVEASQKPPPPPPNPPNKVEHHKSPHELWHHHDYVLVRERKWLDHWGHRHLDRIWRNRHGYYHVEHVY